MIKEKYLAYVQGRHPEVWHRLEVLDEEARSKVHKLLLEYLQQSGVELCDDVDLLGAFGMDDTALEEFVDEVSRPRRSA
jgi:hypothetical protein